MDWRIALSAAAVGYLLGSISFARLVARWASPGTDISKIRQPIPNSDFVFESDTVSATAVRIHVGTPCGCLTGILDMLKVAVPTLAFKLWIAGPPYFLIVAAAGVLGHNWPAFNRFKGGRGESPIFGGLFVIDPLGVVATNLAGAVLGLLSGQLLVLRWAGLVLMIPWLWFRTGQWPYLAYMVSVNAFYWIAVTPELRQFFQLQSVGPPPSQEELADMLAMGRRLGRFIDRYSLRALAKCR
jgi:glycerol-3-phosphate acyltransferase PlsY